MANATDQVLVHNPENKTTFAATRKAFESIYRDRGFELVERGNAERVANAGRTGRNVGDKIGGKQEPAADNAAEGDTAGGNAGLSVGGSAADIAAAIGLENKGDGKRTNSDGEISEGRTSAGRDRGRNS